MTLPDQFAFSMGGQKATGQRKVIRIKNLRKIVPTCPCLTPENITYTRESTKVQYNPDGYAPYVLNVALKRGHGRTHR